MALASSLDFLNVNSFRAYPIKEGMSRTSIDGSFTIPDDFLVDLSLSATSYVARKFYVSKVLNFVDFITVEIADDDTVVAGTFFINVSTHIINKEYYLVATTPYEGANGKLVVGRLDSIKKLPTGTFGFVLETTEFESRTIIPSVTNVNRIRFKNVDGRTYTATGDVTIQARVNLKFKTDVNDNIILDAGDGIGLSKVCSPENTPIKTINGYSPDSLGNFTIDFSDCIVVSGAANGYGILLNDICCKPCSGCEDISILTNRVVSVESELLTLRDLYNNMLETYENLQTAINTICEC